MKKLILALLATSAVAVAAPAFAHDDDDDWDVSSYSAFNQEYAHIWQGIQHGLSDRSYSPYQAQRFFRALQSIRARAEWQERSGQYDPEDIQARLERLHDIMHVAHERGHERLDNQYGNDWNNYSYGNRYYRYQDPYRRW